MNSKKVLVSPIADRLRSARTKKGISQKQLGILAGIDQFSASPRINQYERGKHVPDYATTARLANALSVPVTYFYADVDELAELILLFSNATKKKQEQILNQLKY
ncbi:MAG: helix-turn-helix transcriptional regulator [Methylophaga sp.]|nr:helix-turn-helix transcriptional regulator [Methylophaga sp.]